MLSWLHHKGKIHCILCTDGSISVLILYFRITAILPILVTQQFIPLKGKLALMKLLQRISKIVMNTQTFFAQNTYKDSHLIFFFQQFAKSDSILKRSKLLKWQLQLELVIQIPSVLQVQQEGYIISGFFFRQMDFETFFSYCRILHHFVEP